MQHRVVRIAAGALLLAVATGCVAHEKSGDRFAAVGDWRSAYVSYRAAVAEDPAVPGLQEKYLEARREALAVTEKRARSCQIAGDWGCVLGETDFALSINEGDPTLTALRAQATRELGLQHLQEARRASAQRDFERAVHELHKADAISKDADVGQQSAAARGEIVHAADAEVARLRAAGQFDQARAILQKVATIDPAHQEKLASLDQAQQHFAAAEYERLAQEGDAALARHDWALAQERYAAAEALLPGGRAAQQLQYAQAVAQGDARTQARDYPAAAVEYRRAVDTGRDVDGYAAHALARVEPRPHRIALRSLLIEPTRPDGAAWTGQTTPLFFRMANLLMKSLNRAAGREQEYAALAANIPYENRPNLRVEVTLPDGSRLRTPVKNGLYVEFSSDLIIASNAFDERRLVIRVLQELNGAEHDVGTVDVPTRELVDRKRVSLRGTSIASMSLSAEHAPQRVAGTFGGFEQVAGAQTGSPGHTASAAPASAGGSTVPASTSTGAAGAPPPPPPGAPARVMPVRQIGR